MEVRQRQCSDPVYKKRPAATASTSWKHREDTTTSMKSFLLLAVIVGTAAAYASYSAKPERDADWKTFKQNFGKGYKGNSEEKKRRHNWEKNRDIIEKFNAEAAVGLHTHTLGDNHLSDQTDDELEALRGTKLPAKLRAFEVTDDRSFPETRQSVPSSLDLRTSTCMPAVKNQADCGSCWAFAATTPVEFLACNKTTTKTKFVLSESQLVNCSTAYGNSGCGGGWMSNAWNYVRAAPGQAAASVLPYYPRYGTCKYNNATMRKTSVVSYTQLPNNATIIRNNLATRGPLAVAMLVDGPAFSLYKSGVYSNSTCPRDCSNVNHGMVLVGYGVANATLPYWIVRNSWGATWGAAGYILVARGKNMCNIECYSYAVTV